MFSENCPASLPPHHVLFAPRALVDSCLTAQRLPNHMSEKSPLVRSAWIPPRKQYRGRETAFPSTGPTGLPWPPKRRAAHLPSSGPGTVNTTPFERSRPRGGRFAWVKVVAIG